MIIASLGWTALVVFAFAIVIFVLLITRGLSRLLIGRIRKRVERIDEPPTCAGCGYQLEGLEFQRCPECSALRGFKVPLEWLGLSEAELHRLRQEKQARRAQENNSDAAPL